jgi:hypothetical protein
MTATEFRQTCAAVLNSAALTASSTPTSGDDPKYPDDQIDRAIRVAASKKLGEIALNPKDPRRASLLRESDDIGPTPVSAAPFKLTDLEISSAPKEHVGVIDSVRITNDTEVRVGIPTFMDAVERRLSNTLSLQIPVFYYAIQGEYLRHTGSAAHVLFIPTDALTDVTNVQPEDELDVICWALALLFPFEGGKVAAASHFRDMALAARRQVLDAAQVAVQAGAQFQFPPA